MIVKIFNNIRQFLNYLTIAENARSKIGFTAAFTLKSNKTVHEAHLPSPVPIVIRI